MNLGGGIGGLLNLRQSGTDYSYLYDGKGNVGVVLDSTQAVVASCRYNAFGKVVAQAGTLEQPFRFSTKRYDAGTGLNYYGYRFYAPAIERWMNRDPLGEAGGINLYGFVGNDPVNFFDPLGLVSAGQLGIGNPGSYGGDNNCDSMYDDPSIWEDYRYNYDTVMTPEDYLNMLPIGSARYKNIKNIAQNTGIRKLRKLIEKWGGRGKDWTKKKGIDTRTDQEMHWYQKRGDGTKYGLKPKGHSRQAKQICSI